MADDDEHFHAPPDDDDDRAADSKRAAKKARKDAKPAAEPAAEPAASPSPSPALSADDIKLPAVQDGEKQFKLSDKRFVHVRKWKKLVQVDVREFYEKDGKVLPGTRGISLTAEQWAALKAHTPEIDRALAALK